MQIKRCEYTVINESLLLSKIPKEMTSPELRIRLVLLSLKLVLNTRI